jgi:FtsH-binding integral membrane protein
MTKSSREELAWRGPTIGWAAIVFLLCVVLLVGMAVSGPSRFPLVIFLAAIMLVGLALGPVGLAGEKKLLRLVACTGFFFITILFLLTFADLVTRLN